MNKDLKTLQQISQAGTGFMQTLSEEINALVKMGYDANLVPHYDHLACYGDTITLFPDDFEIDEVVRFENTSDPDDQSILYAISSPKNKIKGVYVESYGLYHDELSKSMLEKLAKGCGAHLSASDSL